jgi:hypothetical protein
MSTITFQPLVGRSGEETKIIGYLIKDFEEAPELHGFFTFYTGKIPSEIAGSEPFIEARLKLYQCLIEISEIGHSFTVMKPIYKKMDTSTLQKYS